MIKTFFTVCWIYIFAFSAYIGTVAYDYTKTQKLSSQTWEYWKDKDPQKMSHVELDASLKAYTKYLNDVVAKAKTASLVPNVIEGAEAQTWELAIAKRDEEGLRKKLGDVIAYKPYPWVWGGRELKNYLIVVVDGLSEEECQRMIMPLYEFPDGKVLTDGWLDYGLLLGKRRYNIDTIGMRTQVKATVDWKAAFDPALSYQPFDSGDYIIDFKTDRNVYDKYNETTVFYGTAPIVERAE